MPVPKCLQLDPQRLPVASIDFPLRGFLSREGVGHGGLVSGDGKGQQGALAGDV